MITKKFTEATTQEYINATKDMKKYIGKKCTFWNENNIVSSAGVLLAIDETRKDKYKMQHYNGIFWYDVCVPDEVIID